MPLSRAKIETGGGAGGTLPPPSSLTALIEACLEERPSERPAVMDVFKIFTAVVKPAVGHLLSDIALSGRGAKVAAPLLASATNEGAVGRFLAACGIEESDHFASALWELGFTDTDDLRDQDICDDVTLTKVGIAKSDIRKLRIRIKALEEEDAAVKGLPRSGKARTSEAPVRTRAAVKGGAVSSLGDAPFQIEQYPTKGGAAEGSRDQRRHARGGQEDGQDEGLEEIDFSMI